MSAKAKAAGVNVSSFWDLKAELSKQQTSLAAKKASGGQLSLKGGVPRPKKVSRSIQRRSHTNNQSRRSEKESDPIKE
jgi:hypothetical protein